MLSKERPSRYYLYKTIAKLKVAHITSQTRNYFIRQVNPRNYFRLKDDDPFVFQIAKNTSGADGDGGNSKDRMAGGDAGGDEEENENVATLAMEKEMIEQFKMLPRMVNRMSELYKETKGEKGVILEYHQKLPMFAAFAGFASIRLGEVGVSRWRKQLMKIFSTVYFDDRQEVKFGRRAGKTYMACFIIACLLVTQPRCSGIFMCLDKGLATENSTAIERFIKDMTEDPKSPFKAKLEPGTRTEGIVRVSNRWGTNKVRCSTDPKRTQYRGKGDNKGFFFVDESDFYEQKAWDTISAVWSMQILVCLYTSQAHQISAASKMINQSVLLNGRAIWRQYGIRPGRITPVVSDDYVKTKRTQDIDILFGDNITSTEAIDRIIANGRIADSLHNGFNLGGGTTKSTSGGGGPNQEEPNPLRSIKRPWFDPAVQTICDRIEQLVISRKTDLANEKLMKELEQEELNEAGDGQEQPNAGFGIGMGQFGRKSDSNKKTKKGGKKKGKDNGNNGPDTTKDAEKIKKPPVNNAFLFNSTTPSRKKFSVAATKKLMRYNKALELLIPTDNTNEATKWSADECVWLMTLPVQQDAARMIALKVIQGAETFALEMKSEMPDPKAAMRPTFNFKQVEELFLPKNRYNDFGGFVRPVRWIIGFDPGSGGSSDSAIVSILVFPPIDDLNRLTEEDENRFRDVTDHLYQFDSTSNPRRNVSVIDIVQSNSLRQLLVITGAEKMTKSDALSMPVTAETIFGHINGLWKTYPQYRTLPIVVIPENNTRHAAVGLGLAMDDINLKRRIFGDRQCDVSILHCMENGIMKELAGLHTSNESKSVAVSRMTARLSKGPSSIAISNLFLTSTLNADQTDTLKVDSMLTRMRREFWSFRTIPPSVADRTKHVTYSSKVLPGETDDFLMAIMVADLGNAEYEKQLAILRQQRAINSM